MAEPERGLPAPGSRVLEAKNREQADQQVSVRRILVVTEGADAWASGYIRALIYRDHFSDQGFEVSYRSRLSPLLTKLIVSSGPALSRFMALGAGRVLGQLNHFLGKRRVSYLVRAAREHDAVYLQKTLSVPLVEELRRATSARLVYDLNDALWLPSMQRFAGPGIRRILERVDAVTCNNTHSLQFARVHNPAVYHVPDPPQIEDFDRFRNSRKREGSTVTIGWIGSPNTAFNLYSIWEPLEELFETRPDAVLRLVGVGHDWRQLPRFEKVPFVVVPSYGSREMIREVLGMDIGLFPLFDVEDSRARGILKATVYMSGGAAVVASPIGDICGTISEGVNGLFAGSRQEWVSQLVRLIEDSSFRERIAAAGVETIRAGFTLDHCFEKLIGALSGAEGT